MGFAILAYVGITNKIAFPSSVPHQETQLVIAEIPKPLELPARLHVTPPPPVKAPEVATEKLPLPLPEKLRVVKPLPDKPLPPALRLQPEAPRFPSTPPTPAPAVVHESVKTGTFASSRNPTVPAQPGLPAQKVQTGGFGDPNGVPANANSHGTPTIARLGSFELPNGPGYGNGTGGANGIAGRVASAGFGDAVNGTGSGRGGVAGTLVGVRSGGFSDATAAAPAAREVARPQTANEEPVEILSKPTPAYTAEARQQKVEGEVVLRVVFGASGSIQVLQVLSGLGHGLDEAAIAAAKQIRFKPATRDGRPVDSTGKLRILFQLA